MIQEVTLKPDIYILISKPRGHIRTKKKSIKKAGHSPL